MSSPPPPISPTTTSSSTSAHNLPVAATIILSAIVVIFSVTVIVCLVRRHIKRRAASPASGAVNFECPDPSLPIFTYGSIKRSTSNSGDCAVCLATFEATDRLRLLPLCCHAFHVECIDTWLRSNRTCPLCRSPVDAADDSQLLAKAILLSSSASSRSFRLEIGSISRRDPGESSNRRSYSVGSFHYVVDEASEVAIHDNKEADVASGSSRLMDYVDRVSHSFRGSGRFFTGSSRRSEVVGVGDYDVEAGRAGQEISEMFRWISGL